jgi:hypothetical protein
VMVKVKYVFATMIRVVVGTTGNLVVVGEGAADSPTLIPGKPLLPFTAVQPVHLPPFGHALPSEQQ